MIEDCGNVLHNELVRCVTEKKVSFAHSSVTHNYYIQSFEVLGARSWTATITIVIHV